jgi:hypothetical protein
MRREEIREMRLTCIKREEETDREKKTEARR